VNVFSFALVAKLGSRIVAHDLKLLNYLFFKKEFIQDSFYSWLTRHMSHNVGTRDYFLNKMNVHWQNERFLKYND
jgi:hypothetical protein